MAESVIHAEVAGSVWKVQAQVGQKVGPDDELIILESMKMEIPVQCEQEGVVTEILVGEQDVIAEGQPLLRVDYRAA